MFKKPNTGAATPKVFSCFMMFLKQSKFYCGPVPAYVSQMNHIKFIRALEENCNLSF